MMEFGKLSTRQLTRTILYRDFNSKNDEISVRDRLPVCTNNTDLQRCLWLIDIREGHGCPPEMNVVVRNR